MNCSRCGKKVKHRGRSCWYTGNTLCKKCSTTEDFKKVGRVEFQYQGRNIIRPKLPHRGRQRR